MFLRVDPNAKTVTLYDGVNHTEARYEHRDDAAHELINAYRDLFADDGAWLKHVRHYVNDGEL